MTKKISIVAAVSAIFFVILNFSGCGTPPVAGEVGFPLIDIVDAEVDIADDSRFAEDDTQWVRSANTRIIGGTLGSKIILRDIT
jgi:hypothetical protein